MRVQITFYERAPDPPPGRRARSHRLARKEIEAPNIVHALGYIYAVAQRTQDTALLERVGSVKIDILGEASPNDVTFALS